MEWDAPGAVLSVRPFGEGDGVAAVYTEAHGRHLGLARGALSRRQAAVWQQGNLAQFRWVSRLADQLGSLTAELVHPTAALAMDDARSLGVLTATCAVADGALPEREPHPRAFAAFLLVIATLADPERALTALVRWEVALLADLGYGLDLKSCALTGATSDLSYVSPRTGRAVAAAASGVWRDRLLPLPPFLTADVPAEPGDLAAGLRLTGHFLARDVFSLRDLPLPAPRIALQDKLDPSLPSPPRSA